MKLLIIRHGDPNYEIDSLTPTGFREAELLSERISKLDVKAFYLSPLGRAQATAVPTLKKMNRTGETLNWLREFPITLSEKNGIQGNTCIWDWLPESWTADACNFDKDRWLENKVFQKANVEAKYREVCAELDALLEKHGYKREGAYYRAVKPNEDTLVFFCHFGLECVLLSHLINVSPMVLWHGTCAAPTSVTTLVTEERRKGIAYFRMGSFGDTAHLYVAGEEPSFSARFCETFDREDQRHD